MIFARHYAEGWLVGTCQWIWGGMMLGATPGARCQVRLDLRSLSRSSAGMCWRKATQ